MLNKAILIVRLAADPELRTTPQGTAVCTFRIAVERPYRKDVEKKADFIHVVAWRSTAEFVAKQFARGRMIGVDGSIQTRNYEDRDGNKRTAFEVVAQSVSFIGPKGDAGATKSADIDPDAPSQGGGFTPVDDQDLPF